MALRYTVTAGTTPKTVEDKRLENRRRAERRKNAKIRRMQELLEAKREGSDLEVIILEKEEVSLPEFEQVMTGPVKAYIAKEKEKFTRPLENSLGQDEMNLLADNFERMTGFRVERVLRSTKSDRMAFLIA